MIRIALRAAVAFRAVVLPVVLMLSLTACESTNRGVSAAASRAGHLSHLERPNYDFAQYLAEKTGGFQRSFGSP